MREERESKRREKEAKRAATDRQKARALRDRSGPSKARPAPAKTMMEEPAVLALPPPISNVTPLRVASGENAQRSRRRQTLPSIRVNIEDHL